MCMRLIPWRPAARLVTSFLSVSPALLARSSESTGRSGVWTFALGAAVYGLPPLKGESTELGITSLGAEVDSPGLAHPTARLSPPSPSFCNAST